MWAIRRTTSSIALRSRTFSAVTVRASYTEHISSSSRHVDKTLIPEPSSAARLLNRYYSYPALNHHYSSIAGTKSSGEEDDDDLADGFSELEEVSAADEVQEKNLEDENNDVIVSEPELSEDGGDDVNAPEKTHKPKRAFSVLYKVIMDSPSAPVQKTLDKWAEKGESISRSDVSVALVEFRKRRMFERALQMLEWLESQKKLEFTEKDYSARVDLLAKAHGVNAAEIYIQKIPESFKTGMVYRTLLANCVQSINATKAEKVFNKMKELKLPLTSFACNQLLLLYSRTNWKKIGEVLSLMEKEDLKPTLVTYGVLIDIKGRNNDINGMEQIVEMMKAEDIEPDAKIKAILARKYIYGGLKEKAKVILQEIEGTDLKENRRACSVLLPLYASLESVDDVSRVWDICKSNPQGDEYIQAIHAFGKLKKIEEVEAVFDLWSSKFKRLPSKVYATVLKVYAENKMLSKGKDLVKQMAESGCQIGPLTWDSLVKLYVQAGEIEKADSILRRASEQNRLKPFYETYLLMLDQYAKRGDIHNAEKMFHRMRQDGYVARMKQYHSLLRAYINANAPAYGFRERLKADNVFPNKALAEQLTQVDAFKRTAVSDLLD
ncbi:pentatricopeptide repeat-containing protein At1g80270, mitochondrial-like [Bidens hawaiensis]|uniref:pentatricopeptide repeat-containing protein At1g80270, mitochondrial-like n=1 Tax=Bidens hawaiensis TaxID=980011 RepID=UPI00404A3280